MTATLPILNAIVTHLSEQCPDWAVELIPNNPRQYYLSHPNGAVLVSYLGSTYETARPTLGIVQKREVTIGLTVLSRDLHDEFGAIALLDSLRLATAGFIPPNCYALELVEERYTGADEETGIWVYELVLKTHTQQVEKLTHTI